MEQTRTQRTSSSTFQDFSRPHDANTERALISAILLDGRDAYDRVADMLSDELFIDPVCSKAYRAMSRLAAENEAIDLVTVAQKTIADGIAADLAEISQKVTLSTNIETYANALVEMNVRRRLLDMAEQTATIAYDRQLGVDELLEKTETALKAITDGTGGDRVESISERLQKVLEAMYVRNEERALGRTDSAISGITTGLSRLDYMTGGWQPGELVVIAARPAMGKTAIMLSMARAAAITAQKNVLIFSLEMSTEELLERHIVSVTNINADSFRRGEMTESEVDTVERSVNSIQKHRIFVDDRPAATTAKIRRIAKKARRNGACDIVFIDYLQLIAENAEKGRNREQAVASMTRDLKILAKELSIPVVLLAQLSRACEQRADKKPELADLRESGAIEQDADRVLFIYRPSVYEIVDGSTGELAPKDKGYLLVRKNRKGTVGAVPFRNNESLTTIIDYYE